MFVDLLQTFSQISLFEVFIAITQRINHSAAESNLNLSLLIEHIENLSLKFKVKLCMYLLFPPPPSGVHVVNALQCPLLLRIFAAGKYPR